MCLDGQRHRPGPHQRADQYHDQCHQSAGATVTYGPPTGVDEDSPLPAATCTPVSGSTFSIGTTVTCTATDSDDTPGMVSDSFQGVVGASSQVSNTINTVNSLHLPNGIQTSFDNQLQAVLTDLADNQTAQVCSDLTSFSNHAQAASSVTINISTSTFANNGARDGGGLFNNNCGTVSISASTFANNGDFGLLNHFGTVSIKTTTSNFVIYNIRHSTAVPPADHVWASHLAGPPRCS